MASLVNEPEMSCCENGKWRRTTVERWERSMQFDSDYSRDVDSGAVELVGCPQSHSYHHVPVIPPDFL